jgi:taurine dioxygenase
MPFSVNPLSESGAAEIVGLDVSQPLAPGDAVALKEAFARFPILAFRDQHLTPDAQAAFSRTFGELEDQVISDHVHPENPYVLILSNEIRSDGTAVGVVDAGDFMHSDSSHRPEPAMATILYAVQNPVHGGDTEYRNMYLVYDALPDELKRRIAGREGLHHASKAVNRRVAISAGRPGAKEFYEQQAASPGVAQPMVRTHPVTGRPALYISPRFTIGIVGMEQAEADPLLDELFRYGNDRRFGYTHQWRDNDLVMWDNRCLTHRACGGYVLPDVRRMHRTVICGDRAFYRAAEKAPSQ